MQLVVEQILLALGNMNAFISQGSGNCSRSGPENSVGQIAGASSDLNKDGRRAVDVDDQRIRKSRHRAVRNDAEITRILLQQDM